MFEDLRKHMDILLVIMVALLVYHLVLKGKGVRGGISSERRAG